VYRKPFFIQGRDLGHGGGGGGDLTSVFLVDRVGSGPGWLDGWITGCPYEAKVLLKILIRKSSFWLEVYSL